MKTTPSWSPSFCPGSGWPRGRGPCGCGHFSFPWPGILGSTLFSSRTHSACSLFPANRIRRQLWAWGAGNLLRDLRFSRGLSSCILRLRISPFSPFLPNERLYCGLWGGDDLNSWQETYWRECPQHLRCYDCPVSKARVVQGDIPELPSSPTGDT